MKKSNLKNLCLAGIFTALIYVVTAYLHIPSHVGYTHVGDGLIYLAASLLPMPYAICAASIGALLADCLTGFAIWAPASVIIKAVTVLFFSSKKEKIITKRNLTALLPSALLCFLGYYVYESLLISNFTAALSGLMGYIMQSLLSSVLYVLLGFSLDKTGIKTKLR